MANSEEYDPENVVTAEEPEQNWGMDTPAAVKVPTLQALRNAINPPANQANPLNTDEMSCGYVACIVEKDGKILCGQRSDGQGWCGPGGHIEPMETPLDAIIRETKEEFGIDLGAVKYLGNSAGKPNETLPVQIYRALNFAGEPTSDMDEMGEIGWFTPEEITSGKLPGGTVFEPFQRQIKIFAID